MALFVFIIYVYGVSALTKSPCQLIWLLVKDKLFIAKAQRDQIYVYVYKCSQINRVIDVSGPEANAEDVLGKASHAIEMKYEFFETTLQIERFQLAMENCKQCVGPLK